VQKAGSLLVVTRFNKPAESPEQLLVRLEARGLAIADRAVALAYLKYVGGYRLKGFWAHLTDPATKQFRAPTHFDEIVQRYEFDRRLRALTFDEVGRIEVAVRSSISNRLSLSYGPHWFIQPGLFRRSQEFSFGNMVKTIEDAVKRSRSPFINHYMVAYEEPCLPPSWGVSECVTFGFWSRTYQLLRDVDERKAISMKFQVDNHQVFESWLHSLVYLRNVICHHGRMLGAKFVIYPQQYKKYGVTFSDPHTFFAPATVISFLLRATGMGSGWKQELRKLFARHPAVAPAEIGFGSNWEAQSGW